MTEPGGQRDAAGSHFQLYRTSEESPVRWRLLGGNHRAIGRSAGNYAAVDDCLRALAELVARLGELDCLVSRVPGNQWAWRLRHQGAELAVAAHSYDRQIRAVHAQLQFRSRAATARVNEAVMVAGARRWRSPQRMDTRPEPVR